MSCKKLVNSVNSVVDDCIAGLIAINNNLGTVSHGRVVIRKDIQQLRLAGKVTIVSGGGSGHEPAWAGFVGPGMLTAAVCGNIFASPPSSTIFDAIVVCAQGNPGGCLVIIKNYTGDRVNFGLAIERARALGLKCAMVVAADDCALTSSDRSAGRRGLCGTMFVHKVAGALAERGHTLEEIVSVCERVVSNMGTMGISLGPCSLPHASQPLFQLSSDELELGLGIHGEAGVKRVKLMTASATVAAMLDHMTNPQSVSCLSLHAGERVAVIVNNLGGTSYLELGIVAKEFLSQLERRGISVERCFCGTFVSSLEMPGVSLTILKVDDDMLSCLDAQTEAPAWSRPWRSDSPPQLPDLQLQTSVGVAFANTAIITPESGQIIKRALSFACNELIQAGPLLNELDHGCGDGDTGSTMTLGAQAVLEFLTSVAEEVLLKPALLLSELSSLIERTMGGTSGALYSLMLSAAATELVSDASQRQLIAAAQSGITAIKKYGRGEPGDRTMLDALVPAVTTLSSSYGVTSFNQAVQKAAEAARAGANRTAGMKAKSGRASYTPAEQQSRVDPGAEAVAVWLAALATTL